MQSFTITCCRWYNNYLRHRRNKRRTRAKSTHLPGPLQCSCSCAHSAHTFVCTLRRSWGQSFHRCCWHRATNRRNHPCSNFYLAKLTNSLDGSADGEGNMGDEGFLGDERLRRIPHSKPSYSARIRTSLCLTYHCDACKRTALHPRTDPLVVSQSYQDYTIGGDGEGN